MKMSSLQRAVLLASIGAAALLLADSSFATGTNLGFNANGKTLGTVAGNITTSLTGFGPLITIICYVSALVFGLVGAMKWKAYGEQPDRTPFKIPVTYWAIAVLLAGFPEFMGTGITTLWGSGAATVSQP